MGEAIGATLGYAVGIAASPLPMAAVIIMLFSGRARWCPTSWPAIVSKRPSDRTEDWLIANNSVVMAVLFLVFAFSLIGDAVEILTA